MCTITAARKIKLYTILFMPPTSIKSGSRASHYTIGIRISPMYSQASIPTFTTHLTVTMSFTLEVKYCLHLVL